MQKLLAVIAVVAVVGTAVVLLLLQNGRPMPAASAAASLGTVVPKPISHVDADGTFPLDGATVSGPLSDYAADVLGVTASAAGSIVLEVDGGPAESYTLTVTGTQVRVVGGDEQGVFNGIQSLRQLVADGRIGATAIEDAPRFAYRGAMLDVARHFFGVDDVKRYIDDIALLKLNYLHLHLTDDQGWRIQIDSWPNLTAHGGTSAVGGIGAGGSGFYTKADYREIVAYAASRFVTIVPEIDMPGHTNAALSSYPQLTCDGKAPALYTGVEVGFSSLCIGSETTYGFVADVLGEIAELTPGPYIHIGGDESHSTTDEDFLAFAARVSEIGATTGKTLIGWHELGRSPVLPAGTIGQYWSFLEPQEGAAEETARFDRVIMSPADVAYLDMKYDLMSPYGLEWANGYTHITDAYNWDPATVVPGIGENRILGVEAPLWTETLSTIDELEYMAFPRIAAIAEIAWSPVEGRDWNEFAPRLAAFGSLLDAEGITYYRTPEVPWND